MKPAPFDYQRPQSIDEAVALLAEAGEEGKALAGGQSLLPLLNFRLIEPALLVDLAGLSALERIEDRDDQVFIGARVCHSQIEDGAIPGPLGQMMAKVATGISYRAVRNRGTIGGSLAHADPAADWPAALTALGGEVAVVGSNGQRQVPLADFFLGALTTSLGSEEVIEGVVVPKPDADAAWGYCKICRKPGEFAQGIGAVLVDRARETRRLVGGGGDVPPLALTDLGQGLMTDGAPVDPDAIRGALASAGMEGDAYQQQVHAVALARAIQEALK